MIKKIFIVFLCFVLLFIAFNPNSLDSLQSDLFDTYDGYKQFYFSSIPDSSYGIDDLWIDDKGNMYKCINDSYLESFSSQHWSVLNQNVIDQNPVYDFFFYNFEVEPYFDFEEQSDGKIELWYQGSDPSYSWKTPSDKLLHYGDFWYDTSNNAQYEWRDDEWMELPFVFSDSSISFDDIFGFGYELTIGTIEVITSVFKGSDVFFTRFDQWRITVLGDITLFDFLVSIVDRSVDFLDSIAYRIPVIRDIKHVIDTILLPFEEVVSDLIDWLSEKIG